MINNKQWLTQYFYIFIFQSTKPHIDLDFAQSHL